jgi:hypothetical protein
MNIRNEFRNQVTSESKKYPIKLAHVNLSFARSILSARPHVAEAVIHTQDDERRPTRLLRLSLSVLSIICRQIHILFSSILIYLIFLT